MKTITEQLEDLIIRLEQDNGYLQQGYDFRKGGRNQIAKTKYYYQLGKIYTSLWILSQFDSDFARAYKKSRGWQMVKDGLILETKIRTKKGLEQYNYIVNKLKMSQSETIVQWVKATALGLNWITLLVIAYLLWEILGKL